MERVYFRFPGKGLCDPNSRWIAVEGDERELEILTFSCWILGFNGVFTSDAMPKLHPEVDLDRIDVNHVHDSFMFDISNVLNRDDDNYIAEDEPLDQ